MIVRTLPWMLLACTAQAAEWPAVMDWSQRMNLSMPVSGVIDAVLVQPGQIVKKGELMASLSGIPFKAAVAEARADVDRFSAEEADAQRDLVRVKELYARTVSAGTELDAAKLRLSRAVAGLSAAEARLERARWQLAEAELRAPYDLIVLARQVEPGMVLASQCQPPDLFGVARADELLARARLESAQLAKLQLGDAAEVIVIGRSIKGTVRALSLQTDGRWSVDVAVDKGNDVSFGEAATLRLAR